MECSICYELIQTTNCCTTKCNHSFCLTCFVEWMRIGADCPLCKTEIMPLPTATETEYFSDEESDWNSDDDDDDYGIISRDPHREMNRISRTNYTRDMETLEEQLEGNSFESPVIFHITDGKDAEFKFEVEGFERGWLKDEMNRFEIFVRARVKKEKMCQLRDVIVQDVNQLFKNKSAPFQFNETDVITISTLYT